MPAEPRGLVQRLRSWVMFAAIDGRAEQRARSNAPFEPKLAGVRSVTAYHLGLPALWAGDAADAEPQFESVIAIAQKTEPLDEVGRQRLAGIEAAAAYGLGLAQAGRGQWRTAIAQFDLALPAACPAAAPDQEQADFRV